MTETVTGRVEKKVFRELKKGQKAETSEPSLKAALAIFLGAIFIPAIIFGTSVYLEDQKNFQMMSRIATNEELAKIKSEYNMVGTTTSISVPNYENVAVSVIERDGRYELIIAKYGDKNWILDTKYRLNLQTKDGSIIQMDRSFLRSMRMSLKGEKDVLLIKDIERWSIEFIY